MDITFKVEECSIIYGAMIGDKERLFFVKMEPKWLPYMQGDIYEWVVRVRPLVGSYFAIERKQVEGHDHSEMIAWGVDIAKNRIEKYIREQQS
jgi:hypothetical protein